MLFKVLLRQAAAVLLVLFAVNWVSGNAGLRHPARFFYCGYLPTRLKALGQMAAYRVTHVTGIPGRLELEAVAENASARYGVDPYLVKALIEVESSFRIHALSPVGACGLMQLLPATAAELNVTNPFDPHQNIDAGVRYLRKLITVFQGDLWAALVAYNWGPARMKRVGSAYTPAMEQYLKKILKARFKYNARDTGKR